MIGCGEWIRTRCGIVKRTELLPSLKTTRKTPSKDAANETELREDSHSNASTSQSDSIQPDPVLPTEVGSRIGNV